MTIMPIMPNYASIMVTLDLGPEVEARIALALGLASMFDARLIGVCGRQPTVSVVGEPPFALSSVIEQDQHFGSEELQDVEAVFRRTAGSYGRLFIRAAVGPPNLFTLAQASAADLLVVGRQGGSDYRDWRFAIDPGELVLQIGRPVLICPPRVRPFVGKPAIIAWKDGREARRAVADALPLLKAAAETTIVAIEESSPESGVQSTEEYLGAHGIKANVLLRPHRAPKIADELMRIAERQGAELIVAGAYGHSRTREWVLGGVTRDLLDHSPACCLLSH